MSSLHSHDFELTPGSSFSFLHTSLSIHRHQPVLHKSFKGEVTSSHSHSFELTNRWRESQNLARLQLTASRSITLKFSSNLARSKPAPSAFPNSLDHSLLVHLQPESIMASKCSSQFTRSRPPSASPNSLYHGLQVHLSVHSISGSKCITKLALSQPASALLSALHLGLEVNLQTQSIKASKCSSRFTRSQAARASLNSLDHGLQGRSQFTRSWPPSASPNALDHSLQVLISVHSISASKCISNLARSLPRSVSLSCRLVAQ